MQNVTFYVFRVDAHVFWNTAVERLVRSL